MTVSYVASGRLRRYAASASRTMLGDDVAVARAPARTYARLVERAGPTTWWRALRRPAVVLLLIGVASAIAATGRVTLGLVASTMLVFSFVIAVQMATGTLLIATARVRQVSVPGAMDLLFAGHLPWSLWVCATAAWAASDAPFLVEVSGSAAVVAVAWNAVILTAYSKVVLQATPREARIRTLVHQGLTGAFVLWFIASTSGGWFRLITP